MDERYRRLHYDPSVVGNPYWVQPTSKNAVNNCRIRKHSSAIPKKKSKEGGGKSPVLDVPTYVKQHRDKYGSVSAHSTSAIYGALRAPHCHAMYSTSDMWYASVRSLNSRPRDIMYPAEAYDWRDSMFEDFSREGCAVPPRELLRRPPCVCMIRKMPVPPSRLPLQCKYCTSSPGASAPLTTVPLPTKKCSLVSEKVKLNSVSEERDSSKPELLDRMSGYKKTIASPSKSKASRFSKDAATKDVAKPSRKSILECDVTAYDLIKKTPNSPSISEVESDLEDLCSNAAVKQRPRLRKNQNRPKSGPSKIETLLQRNQKSSSTKVQKSRSENSIYSESSSVLLGGQRIFTTYQNSRSPDFENQDASSTSTSANSDTNAFRWRKLSVSEESICIPEPDYDYSDNSDDSDACSSKFKDLKLTYSPPLFRRHTDGSISNLSACREISKSMSSLQSQDTLVPSISINRSYTSSPSIRTNTDAGYENAEEGMSPSETEVSENYHRNTLNLHNEPDDESDGASVDYSSKPCYLNRTKYESFSSSDCSSNGGTLSSDYPTWTSSSSSELKSILKKKKKRESAVYDNTAAKVFSEVDAKESQRKKQVQFRASNENTVIGEFQFPEQNSLEDANEVNNNSNIPNQRSSDASVHPVILVGDKPIEKNDTPVIDTFENFYETLNKPADDDSDTQFHLSLEERLSNFKTEDPSITYGSTSNDKCGSVSSCRTGAASMSNDLVATEASNQGASETLDSQQILAVNETSKFSLKLLTRSSSLEDVREAGRLNRRKKKHSVSDTDNDKKEVKRKRRSTLPKRRFSDLHLHVLLCPTRSSLCGDGSSSDDIPLTTPPQRGHRSLPDSPNELEERIENFSFDLEQKSPGEKQVSPSSQSTFYVSVAQTSPEGSKEKDTNSSWKESQAVVSTGKDQSPSSAVNSLSITDDEHIEADEPTSPLQEDTDEDNLENEYENLDPIYEELSDISSSSKRISALDTEQKSFFQGASKTDILSYLEDAKERGISEGLSEDECKAIPEEDEEEEEDGEVEKDRVIVNNTKNQQEVLSEGDEAGNSLENMTAPETDKANKSPSAEVERNDSGVGTETSKPSRISKLPPADSEELLCADCDHPVEPVEDEISGLLLNPLVCRKCDLRRCERKEIIIEFIDTELKYGRDLRIIKEEFYRPMEIAGLLAKDQLFSVFLNLEELINFNIKFSEKLQDALDIAMEQGDEDYTTVNIGKIFLETSSMLHAFETYCVKQASASVLLSNLEKEKELLRIFLRVSQMENTLLRRMNLPAFLMVPVQRVTRYPLLLCRLHKVTPVHHKDRNALKEAQQKVELHLEHINQQTKGVGGTKIWRRISNISASHRRLGNLQDIGSIKLRKMALEILKWKQDEVRFVMAGKLLFTQVTDYPWNKKGKTLKFTPLHALLVALGKPNSNYRPESTATDNPVLFPRNTGIRDASLVLMKEKNGRYITIREPLCLGTCVISRESEGDSDAFEIQEYTTKEAYLLKGETEKDSQEWLRLLRYHAKDLGSWRRRRNALANIMINGMIRP